MSNERSEKRRFRALKRVLLVGVLLLVVGVVVLIVAAPSIASGIAATTASRAGSDAVAGEIKIDTVSLSWGGPIVVGPVEIIDPDGDPVGTTTVTVPMGLLDVLTSGLLSGGPIDLGTVTVEADLDIVRDERGTNLQRALAAADSPTVAPAPGDGSSGGPGRTTPPSDGSSGGPGRSIAMTIEFDALAVDYTDTVNQVKEAVELTGTVAVDHDGTTTNATVDLDTSGTSGGTIDAELAVERTGDGAITELDATATIADVSTRLIEALGGPRLSSMGETIALNASAATQNDDLTAALTLNATHASVALNAIRTPDRIRLTETGKIELPGALITDLAPALAAQLAAAADRAEITDLPRLSVAIESLDLPLPGRALDLSVDPTTLDLRNASMVINAETGALAGRIRPSGDEADAWQSLETDPVRVTIRSASLKHGLTVTTDTKAQIDGQPAGILSIDTRFTELLDRNGRLLAIADDAALPAINGGVSLTGLRTELLQPFMTGPELTLSEEIGPSIDLSVNARSDGAIDANTIPTTQVDLEMRSAFVEAQAALIASDELIRSRNEAPIRLFLKKAGSTATKVVPALADALTGDLPVELVMSLTLPIAADDPAGGLEAGATITTGNGTYTHADGTAFSLRNGWIDVDISPEEPTRLLARMDINQGLNDSTPVLDLKLHGAQGLNGLQAATTDNAIGAMVRALDPEGTIRLAVPGDLIAGLVSPVTDEAPERSAAIAQLIRAGLGNSAVLTLGLEPTSDATDLTLTLTNAGAGTGLNASGRIMTDDATIHGRGTLRANAADLNAVLGADVEQPPLTIDDDAQLAWELTDTLIGLGADGLTLPDLATLALTVDAPLHVTLPATPPAEGEAPAPARTAGLARGFTATIDAPVAAFTDDTKDADLRLRTSGTILGAGDAILGVLNANAAASTDGDLRNARLELKSIRPFHLDHLLGTDQMARQGLGNTGTLTVDVTPKDTPDTLAIRAAVDAPRLTGANINATVAMGDRITLDNPTSLTVRAPKELATDLLFPKPTASADGTPPPARNRVAEDIELTLDLNELTIAMADDDGAGGPLRRGVFALGAQARIPSLAVVRPGNDDPIRLEQVQLDVGWDDSARVLSADGRVGTTRHAGATASRPVTLNARIKQLAQDDGVLTTDAARLDVDANLQSFPSLIVDALGKQGGVLAAALGPGVTLDADIRNLGRTEAGTTGSLNTTLNATRAMSGLNGRITADQRFIASGPVELKLLEITPDLTAALGAALPAVTQLQKKRSDEPAVLRATGLEVPLDGDLSKLNGDITASLGVVQFQTGDILGGILSQVGGRSAGIAGRRVQPFTVRARNGVLTYDRYSLPVGEFDIETLGTINLVNKQMDLLVYTPLFALTDEIAGAFNTGIAGRLGVLDRNTLVPIRVKGSTSSPGVQPDIGLFLEERAESLIEDPTGILDEVLGDKNPLKDLFGPR